MTIQYCDRCGVELPEGEQSGAVNGVEDADENGDGAVTFQADVCTRCYQEFIAWVKTPRRSADQPPPTKRNR